jgi:hypothetical protein
MDTPLYRSRGGTMIHAEGCRFAANAVRWLWADDQRPVAIRRTIKAFGYQTCLACKPIPDVGSIGNGVEV